MSLQGMRCGIGLSYARSVCDSYLPRIDVQLVLSNKYQCPRPRPCGRPAAAQCLRSMRWGFRVRAVSSFHDSTAAAGASEVGFPLRGCRIVEGGLKQLCNRCLA